MAASGDESSKELPVGWTMTPLGELIGRGGLCTDGDWVESKDQDPTGDVRLIQLADIGEGEYRDRSNRFLTSSKAKELGCTYLESGDVLIARMADPLGRACIFPGDPKRAVTVVDVCIFRAGLDGIEPRWLSKVLNSVPMRAKVAAMASGTTRGRISRGKLVQIPIALPPVNEQRRIVARLEALEARSRRARAELEAIPLLLAQARQSLLAAAFRGNLTADWAQRTPGVCPIERTLEGVSVEASRTGRAAGQNIIPGVAALSVGDPKTAVPKGWVRVPLLRVCRLESGHTPSREHPEYWGGDVPWISIPDARRSHGKVIEATASFTNELGLKNSAARLLPEGTVCLSRTASVGYAVVMGSPMATSQDFANWVCSEAVLPKFLMLAFLAEGEHLLKFGKGSTHTTIYFPELKALHICLPPLAEQKEIVRRLEAAFARLDAAADAHAAAIVELDRLDQALLAKAFRGELVPQDPADEPAAVTLQRLRAPREVFDPVAYLFQFIPALLAASGGELPYARLLEGCGLLLGPRDLIRLLEPIAGAAARQHFEKFAQPLQDGSFEPVLRKLIVAGAIAHDPKRNHTLRLVNSPPVAPLITEDAGYIASVLSLVPTETLETVAPRQRKKLCPKPAPALLATM